MRVLITGASRGIGAAVARSFAKHCPGALIALVGRSSQRPSHPGLCGTLQETADDVTRLGATPLIVQADVGDGHEWIRTLQNTLHVMGGLDVLINNASALSLERHEKLKRMDLIHNVNTRATSIAIQECTEALESSRGSIVTMSPPIRLGRLDWIAPHPTYTISKYAMSLATLGSASPLVRANCLWPRRMVATAATKRLESVIPGAFTKGRSADDVAECVYTLAVDMQCNAQCLLDDEVLPLDDARNAPLDAFVLEKVVSR